MMEINSEVNKVFGTEMAKLFAATISEEELKHRAEQTNQNHTIWTWFTR